MSKEEIKLHTIATYNNKQYELQDLLNNLVNSNLKLQQKIDKATELLESQMQDMMGNYFFDDNVAEQLLIILKGEDNERN